MERKKLGRSKITSSTPPQPQVNEKASEGKVSVIVKVKTPGYVPEGFDVRSRINDYIFTADSSLGAVQSHEHNDDIVSISESDHSEMID